MDGVQRPYCGYCHVFVHTNERAVIQGKIYHRWHTPERMENPKPTAQANEFLLRQAKVIH